MRSFRIDCGGPCPRMPGAVEFVERCRTEAATVPNTSNSTAFTVRGVDTGVNVTVPASHPGS
jgi:hypothetical protein